MGKGLRARVEDKQMYNESVSKSLETRDKGDRTWGSIMLSTWVYILSQK